MSARKLTPSHANHRESFLVLGTLIFLLALALRLLFARLVADTYDYDEFVLLLLARDFAHGDVPYRDFMFFHPPGALVLLRGLEPLTNIWWPWARVATASVDAATATLVAYIGAWVFDRRVGLASGMVYAASPLALISATRVGQDSIVTALGMSALALLLTRRGKWPDLAAGICIGAAVWIKYPALYFLPVAYFVSPRRFPLVTLAAIGAFAILAVPFLPNIHALYAQTVSFQHNRWSMPLDQRLKTTALFWIAVNLLALLALARRAPVWLVAGFALGGFFVLSPQVYYHYFVPVVPFASLLAGVTLSRWRRVNPPVALVLILVAVVGTSVLIDRGGDSPLFVTAARLSNVAPTVRLLDSHTTAHNPILADRFEYAYLAHRPALAHYFWNVGVLVNAGYLERRVQAAGAVVLSTGASSGYPPGFMAYLDSRYQRLSEPTTTVWLVPQLPERR